MRAIDAFWGLPASDRVRVAAESANRPALSTYAVLNPGQLPWNRVELPGGCAEPALADAVRAYIPGLTPIEGEPILSARIDGKEAPLITRAPDGTIELAFDPDAAVAALIARRALTAKPPATARLPFSYRRIPAPVRALIRDLMTRRQSRAADSYPAWPYEPSVEVVRALYLHARRAAGDAPDPAPFWPDQKRFALALTQDVDSATGLANAPWFAEQAGERGLRGAWYVVGRDYALDDGAMAAIHSAGAEIGLHDAHHDNRIAFMDRAAIDERLDTCSDLIERWSIKGFRSPSMLRTEALYEGLRGRFAYDSSIPDTGLLPAPNGCATVFPLEWRAMPVLPLTLPPDGQLLGRGLEPGQIVAAWIEKAERVAAVGGAAIHLTHPEAGFSASEPMRQAFTAFADWASSRDDAWHATPAQIMDRWQARLGEAVPARPAG